MTQCHKPQGLTRDQIIESWAPKLASHLFKPLNYAFTLENMTTM